MPARRELTMRQLRQMLRLHHDFRSERWLEDLTTSGFDLGLCFCITKSFFVIVISLANKTTNQSAKGQGVHTAESPWPSGWTCVYRGDPCRLTLGRRVQDLPILDTH
jgi:hypothetical protein